jgi:hypothetical protein
MMTALVVLTSVAILAYVCNGFVSCAGADNSGGVVIFYGVDSCGGIDRDGDGDFGSLVELLYQLCVFS